MKLSVFFLCAVVFAAALAEEAKPTPVAAAPAKEGKHALRGLFQEISEQVLSKLGTRSAIFTARDLVGFLSQKYLTAEGQDVLNIMLDAFAKTQSPGNL